MTNEELKEFIHESQRGIRIQIEASNEIIHNELLGIKEHLGRLNGSVAKNTGKIEVLCGDVETLKHDTSIVRWVKSHPLWVFGILIFMIIIVPVFVDIFGFENLIKLLK